MEMADDTADTHMSDAADDDDDGEDEALFNIPLPDVSEKVRTCAVSMFAAPASFVVWEVMFLMFV